MNDVIERLESEVRSYCRGWPTTFTRATGDHLYDADGREYVDFFAGAGALNYGHNHPAMRERLIEYLAGDGVVHSLDMITQAKGEFLERFDELILRPRDLDYKVQFPGPTGTNAVEAALKLARKVTGRERVVSFTNAFHGMTLGSLSITGNSMKREGAGLLLSAGVSVPYAGFLDGEVDSLDYLHAFLDDSGSGFDRPAAVIVETVQAEGGLRAASMEWLVRLQELCREHETLLIVDDIQAGCGRTGTFFSFEPAEVKPDIVCLSKSLSGFGLPLAVTLFQRDLDVWDPGEHNGTFRGHNPAFVTAATALDLFWRDDSTTRMVDDKSLRVTKALTGIVERYPEIGGELRGRGLLQGIACTDPEIVTRTTRAAFERGLVMETSGPEGEVLKLLPPLTVDDDVLESGLSILDDAIAVALDRGARGTGQ